MGDEGETATAPRTGGAMRGHAWQIYVEAGERCLQTPVAFKESQWALT